MKGSRVVGLVLTVFALMSAPVVAGEAVASTNGRWTELNVNWGFNFALGMNRDTGNLFVTQWREGGVFMSSDLGKTFKRVDGGKAGGNPFSVNSIFATGGRVAVFSAFPKKDAPAPSGHSLDGGKTWTSWTDIERGFCNGVVDWESGTIFALSADDPLVTVWPDDAHWKRAEWKQRQFAYVSTDMGKTWTVLTNVSCQGNSPVYNPQWEDVGLGVFSPNELVYNYEPAKKGIQRSEDGGKTWITVADYACQGPVQIVKGVGYWLSKKEERGKRWTCSLLATTDKGKTWRPVGNPIDNKGSHCMTIPRFGKDEKHIVVGGIEGILETTDGGVAWKLAARYPEGTNATSPNIDTWNGFEYDPVHDVFYLSFKCEMSKATKYGSVFKKATEQVAGKWPSRVWVWRR